MIRTLVFAAGVGMVFPSVDVRAEAGAGGASAGGGVPQVASRYVTRLQERVKKADEAALRGSQLLADGDYEGAITEFRAAIDLLPDAPVTRDRREAYVKQYANACVKLARQRAEEAEYEEARTLLENVLAPDIDPDNYEAKKLLEQLNDPEWYSPALTPEHLDNVRIVEKALKTAQGYLDIGDFDKAQAEYFKVLNADRYNSAARRGMEAVDNERMDYYETARNQTRREFIRRVAEEWALPVPASVTGAVLPDSTAGSTTTDQIAEIENKLKTIIVPSVEFVSTPLRDAIDFLRSRAQELDPDPDPTKRGVDIILATGGGGGGVAAPAPAAGGGGGGLGFDTGAGGAAAPATSSFGGGGVEQTPITLQLNNVPLVEALRYTLALANLKYKVEPNAVVVVPLSTPDKELYTNIYVVPPNFLSASGGGGGGGGGAAPVDPFAAPAADPGGVGPAVRRNAKEVLESYGIVFGQGASATFNPQTAQLIVRQTQDQMELVEAVIESIRGGGEKGIFITSKFVEIGEEKGKELGFDWLLGPFNIGSTPKVFGGGGTTGNQIDALDSSNYSFVQPGATSPVGSNPVTAGLRSGALALDGDSIDSLISDAAGNVQDANLIAPAIFGIAGVFTDPQFQVMIRALNQHKGVDLLSAPSVLARSGQRAKIEVIREFIYPTEYDPPEIPNQVGGGTTLGGGGGGVSSFPVTPATPAAFETRNTGVTLEVDPVIGGDDFTIDLNLAPEVVEFEGFINYGSPINSASIDPITGTGSTIQLTENRIEMPIFSTRKVTTQVTIWDGQTVALGGLIREDIQDVQDKVPLLGDMPLVGRLFRNDVELHLKRNLTVFVKAELVDPAGMKVNQPIGQ